MVRRLHPSFEKGNQWLQSFEGLEPSSFDDMLHILGKLDGEYLTRVTDDALSFRLGMSVSGAEIELFRQTKTEVLRASWLNALPTESDLEGIRSRLETLVEEIRGFNRQAEDEALNRLARENPEITVYPADQDFFMAMPDPRAFFEAAELRENRIVIDRRSSLILEWGAETITRMQGGQRPSRVETVKVIAAGRAATGR